VPFFSSDLLNSWAFTGCLGRIPNRININCSTCQLVCSFAMNSLPDSVSSNGSASVTDIFAPVFKLSLAIRGSSDVRAVLVLLLADRW
jgi:hypothetical protein